MWVREPGVPVACVGIRTRACPEIRGAITLGLGVDEPIAEVVEKLTAYGQLPA
jgi:hypothetical protein